MFQEMPVSPALAQPFDTQSFPDAALFLGVGDASSVELGNSACVLQCRSVPWLLIDCGHDTLSRYEQVFPDSLPSAVFITHLHYDHIGGLEQLYFKAALSGHQVRLYVPVFLVQQLCAMLRYTKLAETKVDVWHTFILHPVSESFWHLGVKLWTYPVRHHAPNSAFALHIPSIVFYSGDTRPIPELLTHVSSDGEVILHDCAVKGNPSHSGIEDLIREYSHSQRNRLWAYHYHSEQDRNAFVQAGLKYARAMQPIQLANNSQNLPL
ncbi:MBL fold metallo-hydrolase [Pseudoalteromonas luteoviolacea]|uniref:Metal-dependent hydrolase of the beta-lactamase superfamily III n=1 Tax=Pseudoalteromonas luteoviolacea (strain 2ta16) TaxID=1353533 RepID=V4HRP9_PSEL2|nr:MBL fold metallo-hydrolase [Pseudoalteromonas luteoviolacea]ESP92438.1 metal-dependent hydrolase of the beta-lactamase superfamily III [Pseudoalteromonas luteoviolacea 2ta16]KZN34998.1 hypothetical protein N483_23945 [Pseudoalteromonas luteoviolacea NCIMB 1944]